MELNASQNKLKHVIKDFKGRLSSYLTHMGVSSVTVVAMMVVGLVVVMVMVMLV